MTIISAFDQVVIRSWEMSDVNSLAHHANNIKIWNHLRNSFPYPYTLNDAKNWINANRSTSLPRNFAIEVKGEAVGGIGFTIRDDINRLGAEIGYWLSESYWNKGIMSRALTGVSDYAFSKFDLVRLYACVFESNTASIKVLENAGYDFEACHKVSIIKNGQLFDEFVYAKLDEAGAKIRVKGKVQGVFFRKSTLEEAEKLKLRGYVKNEKDGSVIILAEGLKRSIRLLKDWCRIGPPMAEVKKVIVEKEFKPEDFSYDNFSIRY